MSFASPEVTSIPTPGGDPIYALRRRAVSRGRGAGVQEGTCYCGGWIASDIVGPFKGDPEGDPGTLGW